MPQGKWERMFSSMAATDMLQAANGTNAQEPPACGKTSAGEKVARANGHFQASENSKTVMLLEGWNCSSGDFLLGNYNT